MVQLVFGEGKRELSATFRETTCCQRFRRYFLCIFVSQLVVQVMNPLVPAKRDEKVWQYAVFSVISAHRGVNSRRTEGVFVEAIQI